MRTFKLLRDYTTSMGKYNDINKKFNNSVSEKQVSTLVEYLKFFNKNNNSRLDCKVMVTSEYTSQDLCIMESGYINLTLRTGHHINKLEDMSYIIRDYQFFNKNDDFFIINEFLKYGVIYDSSNLKIPHILSDINLFKRLQILKKIKKHV